MGNILPTIDQPEKLRDLSTGELEQLAGEIRSLIIETVSTNGGHLASNLGVVDLTLALLRVFDFQHDRIVFDVGHQAYTYKILTGRQGQFCTLRQMGGLSGFPKQEESCFDFFNTGHSSTSISAALGLSRALQHRNRAAHAIAVIGDGALTGGMSFEAMNDAGQSGENLIVILNDNQMSISPNVGGLSRHLENLRISTLYIKTKNRIERIMNRIPLIGRPFYQMMLLFKRTTRLALQQQGILFEQLGFKYYGPIDGHDIESMEDHLRVIREQKGPILLHVLTQKGKGYKFAEESPDLYHGVAPFVIENGVVNGHSTNPKKLSFSEVFGQHLTRIAARQTQICAISAAMTAGTGLSSFASAYPARFYDVGIAEQHAMTLAAGLAAGGMRPVITLYSTFLQRAYDQLLHDVCLQCLPVLLMVDRAGIVGEDGETHQGIYDLSLLLPLPGLQIYCPADFAQLREQMDSILEDPSPGPMAIRYPRGGEWPQTLPLPLQEIEQGTLPRAIADLPDRLPIQQARCLRRGIDISLFALGTMAGPALAAADLLDQQNISAEVIAVSCAKPVDLKRLAVSADKTRHVLFIEESVCEGGLGHNTLPALYQLIPGLRGTCLGVEDHPLCQGSRDQLLQLAKLQPEGIAETALNVLKLNKTE